MAEKKRPIKEGQRIIVKMTDEGTKGDGMCRVEDYVIITPKAEKGRKYEVEVTKLYSTYAFAKKIREIKEEKDED